MNTQDENRDIVQTSAYNPFPEPQTIPSGWDTSGFFSAAEPAPVTESDTASEIENH
jgi:hypothetical protein